MALLAHSPRRAVTPRVSLFVAGLAAALCGALGAYLLQPDTRPPAQLRPATPVPSEVPAPVLALTAPAPVAALAPPQPAALALRQARPDAPLLTVAELQEMHTELLQGPDPGGDFKALGEQMLFADATQRFWQLRSRPGEAQAEQHTLARMIDSLLDRRVQRGELQLADARLLKQHTLDVLQPDTTLRAQQLQRWTAQVGTQH